MFVPGIVTKMFVPGIVTKNDALLQVCQRNEENSDFRDARFWLAVQMLAFWISKHFELYLSEWTATPEIDSNSSFSFLNF